MLFVRSPYNNAKNRLISFLEPGTAPRKVQVRPLSSSTMVIQWDEPETPNGQVTVGVFSEIISHRDFPDIFATFLLTSARYASP